MFLTKLHMRLHGSTVLGRVLLPPDSADKGARPRVYFLFGSVESTCA